MTTFKHIFYRVVFSFMQQVLKEAQYIIDTNKTIREAAQVFGISKSVLHRYMSQCLKKLDYELYLRIKNIFLEHNKYRHIKGGEATRIRYMSKG